MKKFLTFLLIFFVFTGFSQKITLDFAFIKAENINDYDQNLKTKFQKVNQNYIDDGRILGWHVWKVLNGSQTPFTHVAVSIYDLDIVDDAQMGDINMDGNINVLDVILLLELVLYGEYSGLADLNADGVLNVLDVIALVNIILAN